MRRIYFLIPSTESARQIVTDLLVAHIPERHIHIVAREGTSLEDLPKANLAQSSDLVPALERGLAAGGVSGALAGLLAVSFPPAGLALGGGALLGMTAFGAGFGAWVSAMIGASVPNSHIRKYEEAIRAGQLLLMVDVPRGRVEDVEELIRKHHPEAELKGADPPLFP